MTMIKLTLVVDHKCLEALDYFHQVAMADSMMMALAVACQAACLAACLAVMVA